MFVAEGRGDEQRQLFGSFLAAQQQLRSRRHSVLDFSSAVPRLRFLLHLLLFLLISSALRWCCCRCRVCFLVWRPAAPNFPRPTCDRIQCALSIFSHIFIYLYITFVVVGCGRCLLLFLLLMVRFCCHKQFSIVAVCLFILRSSFFCCLVIRLSSVFSLPSF